MTRLRHLLIGSLVVLAGCASGSGSSALFMLDQAYPPTRQTTLASARRVLVVDTVTVAPYLDKGGLVYQTAPYRVVVANNNRWASPLPTQLTDSLYTTLSTRLVDISIRKADQPGARPAPHLHVQIDEFLGHYDGSAHITGQWTLLNADGEALVSNRFERRVPLDQDGYTALVASLSRGWRQTVRTIAPEIKDVLQQHD